MTFFLLICYLQGLTEDLKRPPDTLEDLKFVLRVIADIRDKSLDVELRYVDLQERYRTLLMYEIEVREKKYTTHVESLTTPENGTGIAIVGKRY